MLLAADPISVAHLPLERPQLVRPLDLSVASIWQTAPPSSHTLTAADAAAATATLSPTVAASATAAAGLADDRRCCC